MPQVAVSIEPSVRKSRALGELPPNARLPAHIQKKPSYPSVAKDTKLCQLKALDTAVKVILRLNVCCVVSVWSNRL